MSVDEPGSKPALDLPATSQPARRASENIGITSLQALGACTEREIAHLHGMGPKGIRLLKEAMAAHGLGFRDPALGTRIQ